MGEVIEFKQENKDSVLIPATFRSRDKDYILIFEFKQPEAKQERLYLKNFNKRFKSNGDEVEILVEQNNEVNKTLAKELLVNIRGIKGNPEREKLLDFVFDRPELLSMVIARLMTNFSIERPEISKGEELVLESLDAEKPEIIKGTFSVYNEETAKVEAYQVTHTLKAPSDIDRLGYLSRSNAVINQNNNSWGKAEDVDYLDKLYDKLSTGTTGYELFKGRVPLYHKVQVVESLFNTVSLKND